MINLKDNRQRNDFTLVIDDIFEENKLIRVISTDEIVEFLKTMNCDYYVIKHIKEVNQDTGLVKKDHIHIVIHMISPRKRCGTLINEFVEGLNCEPIPKYENAFHIELCRSLYYSVRYLMHLDSPDKETYFITDVKTNNVDFLNYAFNIDSQRLNFSSLVSILQSVNYSKSKCMSIIGLDNYTRYHYCIDTLCNDYVVYGVKNGSKPT